MKRTVQSTIIPVMSKINILGINSSPHKDGATVSLLKTVLNGAKKVGAATEIIHLYDFNIKPAPGNYSVDPKTEIVAKMPKDDMQKLYPKIIKADGLVLATPNYWANMSGVMKNFIDRLTPLENEGFKLERKIAAFIAVSKENEGGTEMAAMSMVSALGQMGVCIPPNGIMWHPGKWVRTEGADKSWAFTDAPEVGQTMVKLAQFFRN